MLDTASEILARSGEAAKSGPIGFAIVLVLAVACYFLFKSMSKHMKTVRENFPVDDGRPKSPAGSTTNVESSGPELIKPEPMRSDATPAELPRAEPPSDEAPPAS